ncbi:MAG: ABC transporter substrate-binding protein, partial [Thermoleophilaceae bacterium]|nr:ABC transporter substrate-binding protein [Thermoleophilaceae bacterium]
VKNIKDLEGKRVGTSGAYQSAYLDAMLEDNGVDPATVKDTNVGFDLNPALVAGKVDATVGGYWNVEAIQLKQAGKPVTATPVDKLGAPPYDELVIIASEDTLNDQIKSDRIRQFLAGLKKGTADAKANPALAVAALLKADKTQDPTFVKASVAATLPALTANAVFGYLDPKKWDTYAKWMRDNNLLKNPPTTTDAFTNDLLPSTVPK